MHYLLSHGRVECGVEYTVGVRSMRPETESVLMRAKLALKNRRFWVLVSGLTYAGGRPLYRLCDPKRTTTNVSLFASMSYHPIGSPPSQKRLGLSHLQYVRITLQRYSETRLERVL